MRILHLEEDARDAELVRAALQLGGLECEVHLVTTRPEYSTALDGGSFDVILSDSGVPGFDDLEALSMARERRPDVPFLVVSGQLGGEEGIGRCIAAGAAACVPKSRLEELAPAIMNALAEPHDLEPDEAAVGSGAMARLVSVVQRLSLARNLESVIAIVRRAARLLTGADGATFILRDGEFCHYVDEDAIAPLWKGRRFPMSACISGWAMLNRRPAAIEDIYADDRIPTDAYRPTFVKSLAMVPIRTLSPIGAIGNYWAHRHLPSRQELKLLQALADTTAVAMENVRVLAELEQRVRDRTSSLEAANQELEAFSYAVSHDLRAPLRQIEGFVGLLAHDAGESLNQKGQSHVEHIRGATLRMGQLIEDLLTLSRTTQVELSRGEVDLSRMAREILGGLQSASPDRQAEFVVAQGMRANGDERLLRIAMENLLNNAWKFTSGRPTTRIEVGVTATADGQPGFFVKDNGAGFHMSHSERLFGAFQRLHSDREFPGTGIGLATVRRVIHKHGGRVWAEAEVGRGATFYFTLERPIPAPQA